MIIKPSKLSNCIVDIVERNRVMQRLLATPLNNSATAPLKWVLATWLGSNVTLSLQSFSEHIEPYALYVDYGFFICFLLNRLGMNCQIEEENRKLAQNSLSGILHYYNKHSQMLIQCPKILFVGFLKIIKQNHNKLINPCKETRQVFDYCIRALSRVLRADAGNIRIKANQEMNNLITKSHSTWFNYLPMRINRLVSSATHYLMFKVIFEDTAANLRMSKILIPTPDGQIIDGLYIEPIQGVSKEVVISLIGHMPIESDYLANIVINLFTIFKVPMLFPNHRNFSVNSTRYALYLDSLVQDTLCFVDYFQTQKKKIVLYGMCGGTATIIQAALTLSQRKQPFKLIVDRASQRYSDWIGLKLIWRLINLSPSIQLVLALWLVVHFFIFMIGGFHFLLKISKNDIDFGALLKQIPAADVLVLQGKGSKHSVNRSFDHLVHPDNDLRQIYKKERHEHRMVLKELKQFSLNIAKHIGIAQKLDIIFLRLANCFDGALQLIDNEKLQIKSGIYWPSSDSHTLPLNYLKTRHSLGLTTFFHGFFKSSNNAHSLNVPKTLYTYGTIAIPLADLYLPTRLNDDLVHGLTNDFMSFFRSLREHQQYLNYMGNRVYMSEMDNLQARLEELFQTPLVSAIEEANRLLWASFELSL